MKFANRERCVNCGKPIVRDATGFLKFVLTYRYDCKFCGTKLVLNMPTMAVLTLIGLSLSVFSSLVFEINVLVPLSICALISAFVGFWFSPFSKDKRAQ